MDEDFNIIAIGSVLCQRCVFYKISSANGLAWRVDVFPLRHCDIDAR